MPVIDFSRVEETHDFSPVPKGKYNCKLVDIEETNTQQGHEMWKLKFEIIEGVHAGRYIYDNMVFSEAALKRAKLICARLGLDTSREVNLTPKLLEGRNCILTVEQEDYEDQDGNPKKRNIVAFAGYERVYDSRQSAVGSQQSSSKGGLSESKMPF